MGKRGRIGKSNAEKLEMGDSRHEGKKKLAARVMSATANAGEISVQHNNVPAAPSWLSEQGKEVWKRLTPDLLHMGIFAAVDTDLIGKYCQFIARAIECEGIIAQKGLTIEYSNGTIAGRPELKIGEKCWSQAEKLAPMLGITYSARLRLGIRANTTTSTGPAARNNLGADDPKYDVLNAVVEGVSLEEYKRMRGRL